MIHISFTFEGHYNPKTCPETPLTSYITTQLMHIWIADRDFKQSSMAEDKDVERIVSTYIQAILLPQGKAMAAASFLESVSCSLPTITLQNLRITISSSSELPRHYNPSLQIFCTPSAVL